jgi:hypothetical protein
LYCIRLLPKFANITAQYLVADCAKNLDIMVLKISNLVAFILVIVMNYLANALPINGKTTGELSAEYPNLFVPAGITFSIWGIIYLLLAAFIVMQFMDANKELVSAIGWAFVLSSIFNALWIVAWHYQKLSLSLLIMLGLLVSLIYINYQLRGFPSGLIKATFGIYLGWICIATIANVTALLVNYNWGGWGIPEEAWAIIMIGAGSLISAVALLRLNNPFLALAVIWAFIGIVIKRQNDFTSIVIAAVAGALLMLVVMIYGFRQLVRPVG